MFCNKDNWVWMYLLSSFARTNFSSRWAISSYNAAFSCESKSTNSRMVTIIIMSKVGLTFTYKYHGTGSLAQTHVLQPKLLILVLAITLPDLRPGLSVARWGRQGSQGRAGAWTWESRLGRECLQCMLSLFISLHIWVTNHQRVLHT